MSRGIHRVRALAIAAMAVCGLMAVMAAGAQAGWLVGTGELTSGTKNVLVKQHTTGKLIVESLNFEIRCEELEASGLVINGSTNKSVAEASGKVAFKACTGYEKSSGIAQKNCKPQEPIIAGGRALVILHEGDGKNYVLFEPETGKPFTTVVLSELCALAETSEVTGSLVAECGRLSSPNVFTGEDCKEKRITHLLRPAPEALFVDRLKFGENAAKLQGIASVELESKEEWSGEV